MSTSHPPRVGPKAGPPITPRPKIPIAVPCSSFAIEQGYQQREIQENSFLQQKAVDSGRTVVVGVNKFTSAAHKIPPLNKIDPEIEEFQKRRLAAVRQKRDNQRCKQSLDELQKVALGTENTVPAILACIEAYASVGEICDVLRNVFGTQKEFLIF